MRGLRGVPRRGGIVSVKFGRAYSLYIQEEEQSFATVNNRLASTVITPTTPGFLQVELPLTVEFDINRDILASCNTSSIRVYNLAQGTRSQIFHLQTQGGFYRQVQLQAGYQNPWSQAPNLPLPVIFNGNIREAWSVREGNNFITQIESFDGGFAFQNSTINTVFAANTKDQDKIKTLLSGLDGVSLGHVGSYTNVSLRQTSMSGNIAQILKDHFTGFYIDNGVAYCLNDNECVPGSTPVISSETGLLGTPRIEAQKFVVCEMLFEPNLRMSELVELRSKDFRGIRPKTDSNIYKVIGIHHKGVISGAVCGEAITTVKLTGGLQFKAVGS